MKHPGWHLNQKTYPLFSRHELLIPTIMRNQILETIKTRRSVRKYKKTQIKDDELENVLVAGTYAPTARGLQAPYIVAVQKPELKEQLIRMNAEIMGVTSNPYYDAPTIVLVFAPADGANALQDGSCVLENHWIRLLLDQPRTGNVHDRARKSTHERDGIAKRAYGSRRPGFRLSGRRTRA